MSGGQDKERIAALTTTVTTLQAKAIPAIDVQGNKDAGIAVRQINDQIRFLSGGLKDVKFK